MMAGAAGAAVSYEYENKSLNQLIRNSAILIILCFSCPCCPFPSEGQDGILCSILFALTQLTVIVGKDGNVLIGSSIFLCLKPYGFHRFADSHCRESASVHKKNRPSVSQED